MKSIINLTSCLLVVITMLTVKSNAQQLPSIGVLNIKSTGVVFDNEQSGDLVRLELEKLNKYEVLQREDAKIVMSRAGIKFDSCYSKESLIAVGKLMKADYMLSGYVTRFGEKIVIRLMIINVSGGFVEKSNVMEYLNLQTELQMMFKLSLKKMLGEPVDESMLSSLTLKSFDSKLNNPGINKLVLTGPRIGLVMLTGEDSKRLMADEDQGGFGINRNIMTVFGYQKELQYINEGNFQALFEFIPAVSGLDIGRFIPSFTIMNGFRDNSKGWEFALGPQISVTQTAKGFYDANGRSQLGSEFENPLIPKGADSKLFYNLDKRGDAAFQYAFVFAAGKSIRSGSMNLPLNLYATVSKNSYRIGLTFGFNSKSTASKGIN